MAEMRLRGVPFNAAQHEALIERLQRRHETLTARITAALGGRNPRSGDQVAGWLEESLPAAVLKQ